MEDESIYGRPTVLRYVLSSTTKEHNLLRETEISCYIVSFIIFNATPIL